MVILRMRNAKRFIDKLIEDPSIGVKKVEKILDATHALSLHVPKKKDSQANQIFQFR